MFTTQSNAEKVAERLNNSASQATKHDLSWLARVGNVLGMTRMTCFGDVTGLVSKNHSRLVISVWEVIT